MLGDLWICVRPTSETCLWKITESFSREIMVQNPAEIFRTTHQLCLDSEYPEIATFTCIYNLYTVINLPTQRLPRISFTSSMRVVAGTGNRQV